jgi:serine/threonine-protein kinase
MATAGFTLQSLIGQAFAGYQIEAKIGSGGMATVFRGRSLLDGYTLRAIKVVNPELSVLDQFVKFFIREARLLERLSHPNIVRSYKASSEQDLLYLEMEFLEGQNLLERMQTGTFSLQETLSILEQAASGVAAAHALSILHRDLKPANIFLTREGVVKILDFGVARAMDEADRTLSLTGTVPGAPAYMAPEVCKGGIPEPAADVYALGIILFELLAGHHPFRVAGQPPLNSYQLINCQLNTPIPPIGSLVYQLPPGLEAIVTRATEKDPASRYPDAGALLAALHELKNAKKTDSIPDTQWESRKPDPSPKPSPRTSVNVPDFEKRSGPVVPKKIKLSRPLIPSGSFTSYRLFLCKSAGNYPLYRLQPKLSSSYYCLSRYQSASESMGKNLSSSKPASTWTSDRNS